jgi:hypothetical protein
VSGLLTPVTMKREREKKVNLHVNIMRPRSPVSLSKQYDFFHRKLLEFKRYLSLLWKRASSVSEHISVVEE